MYAPTINAIEASEAFLADLENALAFGFVIAYAQGLSMLAKASDELTMNIPLPSVIQVWKSGCIIRSDLLGNFTRAFEKEAKLPNLLLDAGMAELLKKREDSVRRMIGAYNFAASVLCSLYTERSLIATAISMVGMATGRSIASCEVHFPVPFEPA